MSDHSDSMSLWIALFTLIIGLVVGCLATCGCLRLKSWADDRVTRIIGALRFPKIALSEEEPWLVVPAAEPAAAPASSSFAGAASSSTKGATGYVRDVCVQSCTTYTSLRGVTKPRFQPIFDDVVGHTPYIYDRPHAS